MTWRRACNATPQCPIGALDVASSSRPLPRRQAMQIDIELDRNQWEALRALGAPDPDRRRLDRQAFEQLIASELAALQDGLPVITARGRQVVVRGSPRLWDLSAWRQKRWQVQETVAPDLQGGVASGALERSATYPRTRPPCSVRSVETPTCTTPVPVHRRRATSLPGAR